MAELTLQQLHRFEDALREARAPVVDAFLPGLDRDAISAAFSQFDDLALPEELFTWWSWHGGTTGTWQADTAIGFATEFLGPAEVARNHAIGLERDLVEPGWLQWMNRDRPWMFIQCDASSPRVGRIQGHYHGEAPAPLADSLGDLVDGWIRLLELKVWTFDGPEGNEPQVDESRLPAGDDFLRNVALSHANPGSCVSRPGTHRAVPPASTPSDLHYARFHVTRIRPIGLRPIRRHRTQGRRVRTGKGIPLRTFRLAKLTTLASAWHQSRSE